MARRSLTPLEALEEIKKYSKVVANSEELNIIESALKEKETQDSVIKTLKEVIEFAQVLPHIEPNKDNGFDIMSAVGINIQRDITNRERELLRQWVLKECFPKELKALEIIKEKRVNVDNFLRHIKKDTDYVEYKRLCGLYKIMVFSDKDLTQEEYDLLKETLL